MDDKKIKAVLRNAMGNPNVTIKQEVLSELKSGPIALFDDLSEHEKTIAITAFLAAAAATQNADEVIFDPKKRFKVYVTPTLGEKHTHEGLVAAAAALGRIPEKQRSKSLTDLLRECGCNPIPDFP